MTKKQTKQGFTLIELVVVMAIIAVLAALMVAAITAARRQSTNVSRAGAVKTIETALETYASKNGGQYPYLADTKFSTLQTKLTGNTDSGPYLTQTIAGLNDNIFVYSQDGTATTKATKYTLAVCDVDNEATSGTAPTATAGSTTITGCKSGTAYVTTR